MNPATGAVLTTTVVVLGRWSGDQKVTTRLVVGGAALAIGLSVLAETDEAVATAFTTLIVAVAVFTYLPAIAWKVGLLDHSKYPKPPKWIP